MRPTDDRGLRIGELADLAGTTARAIRHYHRLGLLAEPARDSSGYRRYGPQHLVRLVRIRRLRALDMPLDRIADTLGAETGGDDVAAALRTLAGEIEEQIAKLQELRARVLEIAVTGRLADPVATWAAELRQRGLLDPAGELPPPEQAAAQLLDALHPEGIRGVIGGVGDLFRDAAATERLGALLRRFQALPDDAADEVVEALAADWVAALPTPAQRPPAIDPQTMERLLGDRLSPARLRCLRRLRELLEEQG